MKLSGKWYDGETSVQTPAYCSVDDDGIIRIEHEKNLDLIYSISVSKIKISSRLANTSRHLLFPGGEKFETNNNDLVDRLSEQFKYPDKMKIVHHLESRLAYILTALLILIAIFYGGIRYGIPLLAKKIAFVLPSSVHQLASEQTIEILDRSLLQSSKLDEGTQNRVRAHFRTLRMNHPDLNLKTIFRQGGKMGPNAFALPDGTIIFTDEIVMAAEHDNELLAILAHETAHVEYRHGMRTIIQDSLLGFALLSITGDVSGSSELFLGLPVLLTELAYSREFEKEADQYALDYLRAHDIDPIHFANLIRRIEKTVGKASGLSNNEWTSYLSTHPMTKNRLKRFEE